MLPPASSRHLLLPAAVDELLRRCRTAGHLNPLRARLLVQGSAVAAQLLASYCALSVDEGGDAALCHARRLFDAIPSPDRFAYNSVIGAFCNGGFPQEALRLQRGMVGKVHPAVRGQGVNKVNDGQY
ncbi:hypothetical protein ACP4OV_025252 [Aristida adscensionis]